MAVSLILAMSVAGLAGWTWAYGKFWILLAVEVPLVYVLTRLMRGAMHRMPLRAER
jgi:hypothetical protein